MKGITIFTVPKAFKGHIGIIQFNAVKSWTLLCPRPEIILFGNEAGTSAVASRLGLHHVPGIKHNELGSLYLDEIFKYTQETSKNDILLFINCDNILMNDFLPAVERTCAVFPRFLLIGQRTDVKIMKRIDFESSDWQKNAYETVLNTAFNTNYYTEYALDFFVFTKYLWENILSFVIGRARFDRWLLYHALMRDIPVIDVSYSVMVAHQRHDYSHLPGGRDEAMKGREAQQNIKLAGGNNFPKSLCISHATWELTPSYLIQRRLHNKNIVEKAEISNLKYLSRHLFDIAVKLTFLKKYDCALELYNTIISAEKNFFMGRYYRALVLLQAGRKEDSIAELKELLEINPDYLCASNLLIKIQNPDK